jgi:chaperonin GroEL
MVTPSIPRRTSPDLVREGVIDPTRVARTALQNATSIAGLLPTTEAVVAELPEEKKKAAAAPMPGADMDF